MSTSICQYHGAKSIYNSTCQYQYINMDMSISLCQYQYVNIIMSISIQYQESVLICQYHYVVIIMSLSVCHYIVTILRGYVIMSTCRYQYVIINP